MNNRTGTGIDKKGKLSIETEIEIKGNLCGFIRFHSDSKQLSEFEISMFDVVLSFNYYFFTEI